MANDNMLDDNMDDIDMDRDMSAQEREELSRSMEESDRDSDAL